MATTKENEYVIMIVMETFIRILLAIIWSIFIWIIIAFLMADSSALFGIILGFLLIIIPFCLPPIAYITLFRINKKQINIYSIVIAVLLITFIIYFQHITVISTILFFVFSLFFTIICIKLLTKYKDITGDRIKIGIIFILPAFLILYFYVQNYLNIEYLTMKYSSEIDKSFCKPNRIPLLSANTRYRLNFIKVLEVNKAEYSILCNLTINPESKEEKQIKYTMILQKEGHKFIDISGDKFIANPSACIDSEFFKPAYCN